MRAKDEIILRDDPRPMDVYRPSMPQVIPSEVPEQSVVRGILRHSWIVAVCAMLAAAGAWFYLKKAQRLYTSECKIYIEPTGIKVLNDTLGSTQRSNYLYTQAEFIKSTPILNIVADMPGIREMRTFQVTNGDPVRYLREVLVSEVGRRDDLISIQLSTPYPDESAAVVDAVVKAYMQYQSLDKKTNSSKLLETLHQEKARSDAELQGLTNQMLEFQKQNPALTVDRIFQEELSALSGEWTRAKLATIEAKSAYQPGHPLLQKAVRREEDLYTAYQKKLGEVMKLNIAGADLQKLASALAEKKEFARRLDDRIKELEVNQNAEQIFNNIEIIEPPMVADGPSFPREKRTLAAAVIAGALLGCGLALLRDRLDGRMRSVEEIQTVVGMPILGVVPAMTGRRTAVARAMTVHLDPRSVVAEAYRTVRTAVFFGANAAQCRTILLTSPEPGDGKTTCASNLAIAIAQTGRSVLLLDADFRKPTQHKNLDIKDAVGLSSVLAGRESLDRAIQRTGVEGLDILACGPIPANPSEILNSHEFAQLVEQLMSRYDHVIFDSPPVNAVTDARILGALCDGVILVVRADKSTRKSAEHARNALLAVGARVLGAIVNDAPNRRGYEVYGGSYYGRADVEARSQGVMRPSQPQLARPTS